VSLRETRYLYLYDFKPKLELSSGQLCWNRGELRAISFSSDYQRSNQVLSSYALSLLYNLNISVDQMSSDTFQSSFYVQPSSTLHFDHRNNLKDSGSRNRKPAEIGTFELSLGSVHLDGRGAPAFPSTSRTTIGKLEEGTRSSAQIGSGYTNARS